MMLISLRSFINTHRPIISIWALSLIASTAMFLWLLYTTQAHDRDIVRLTGDAKGYLVLAENLLEHGAFTFSEHPPFAPESFRSPGYPAFLAALYALIPNWLAVLFVQVLLTAVAPVLLYLLLRPYHERAALWGSVLFALEPTRLFLSASLLSDAVFTVLLLLSLLLLDSGRRKESLRRIAWAGLFLGACVLVRPIAIFLPLLYVGFLFFTLKPIRTFLAGTFALALTTSLILVPWMARNYALFGSPSISSVGAANLVLYNAPTYLEWSGNERGRGILEGFKKEQQALPREEALSLAREDVFTSTFRDIIRGEEFSYLFFHVVKTSPFFLTDGLREIVRLVGVELAPMQNITTALLKGDVRTPVDYVREGGLSGFLLLIGSGFWGAVSLLFLIGAYLALRGRRMSGAGFFFIILVFYFALLTGPVSNARYRLPAEGFMLVIAMGVLVREASAKRLIV